MDNGLEFYRLREWLTIEEICCLACGRDPGVVYVTDADEHAVCWEMGQAVSFAQPDGYDSLQELIIESVNVDMEAIVAYENTYFTTINDYDELPEDISIIFSDSRTRSKSILRLQSEGVRISVTSSTPLKLEELFAWFNSKNLRPEFFFPSDDNKLITSAVDTNSYKHSTSLLSILNLTINRYYGDNYDPNDKDTIPKQRDVVDWLMTIHSLSKRQAEAIDIITRPETLKNSKAKK